MKKFIQFTKANLIIMNQHKMYRCIKLMQYLEDKPRHMHTIGRYLGVNIRTVYRYIKLFEAVGYITIKDKNDKIRILKTY